MKHKTAIILRGSGKCGKTETLICLIKKLECLAAETVKHYCIDSEDQWRIMKYENKTIAISTCGDSAKQLLDWVQWVDCPCDIYLCPCRISGGSFLFADSHFSGCRKIWWGKWYINDNITEVQTRSSLITKLRKEVNQTQASLLLHTIERL